jgi:serine phosphatase RsbU (regulator of sigma subunit)
MDALQLESAAFQKALLKSERLRIRIVIAAIAISFLLRSLMVAIFFSRENFRAWVDIAVFAAVFLSYELVILRRAERSIQRGSSLPRAAWMVDIVVETSMPAFVMVLLSSNSINLAYRPLANPGVLLYFIFIMLSALRLDPAACRISGFVAAASYLAAAAYLGWRPSELSGRGLFSPERTVIGFAGMLFISGFVASAMAGEIRKQVDAALREAELKRRMERLEHDMEVARAIQQSLLPTTSPELEGFEIAGWNQPADETGGDFYDWQMLPDGKLVVALADVTGHGIGPALLASVCRAYARASFTHENGLMAAMEELNDALIKDIGNARFVTFVAAICSPRNTVELLSAGHGPLFLYWLNEDRFDAFEAQGLPLGVMNDLESEPPKVLDLHPGDMLVLTTDGFFEWANQNGEEFGMKRMKETIRAARDLHPADIISTLYRSVIDFSGGTKQKDDLTAVIIKRRAV